MKIRFGCGAEIECEDVRPIPPVKRTFVDGIVFTDPALQDFYARHRDCHGPHPKAATVEQAACVHFWRDGHCQLCGLAAPALLFPCRHCDLVLESATSRHDHEESVHPPEEKRYEDRIRVEGLDILPLHLRGDMLEKPGGKRNHQCRVCPRAFEFLSDLDRHHALHHFGSSPNFGSVSQPEEKPGALKSSTDYQCSLCTSSFPTRKGVDDHFAQTHAIPGEEAP